MLGQPYLRGVGSDLLSAGADGSVAVFVDGDADPREELDASGVESTLDLPLRTPGLVFSTVYQARAVATLQDFYDVERVEVLKGPQGTRLARSVTGGAIQIVNRAPQPDLGGEVDLLYGNYDKLRVRGALNLPTPDDRAILRISGLRSARDGFTDNRFLDRDLDDEDFWALRGQLLLRVSEDATLLLRGDRAREESTRGLAPKVGQPLSGNPGVALGAVVPPGPRDVLNDTVNSASVEAWGAEGELTWELGPAVLSSLTAYRSTRFAQRLDFDATEIPVFVSAPAEDSKTFTQELRVSSPEAPPLEWLAGLFYLHENASQRVDTQIPLAALRDTTGADLLANAVGAFGELAFEPSDVWRLSAGLRYSYETRREDFDETLNAASVAAFDLRDAWDAWTPRFVVEYTPSWATLAYASISRGFKSGGFNSTAAQPFSFDAEFVWAYEAGLESTWLDGRLRSDVALFYYDYDDIQLQVFTTGVTFPQIVNAGAADVLGVEAACWLNLLGTRFEGLELEGSFAWLDATFSDLVAVDPNNPGSDPDRSGNRLPRAPQFSLFVAAQYRLPLGGWGTLVPRVEYRYQSGIYFSIFEDPFVRQPAYHIWNLRLAYEAPDRRWSVAGFARNLGDELYAQNVIRTDGVFGKLSFWGAPRSYGFQVGVRY